MLPDGSRGHITDGLSPRVPERIQSYWKCNAIFRTAWSAALMFFKHTVAWWYCLLSCLQLVVGPSTFLVIWSGTSCLKTLFRRRHFQPSGVDSKLSCPRSHNLLWHCYLTALSAPLVVLVNIVPEMILISQLAGDLVINQTIGCHYSPLDRRLPSQPKSNTAVGRYQIMLFGDRSTHV